MASSRTISFDSVSGFLHSALPEHFPAATALVKCYIARSLVHNANVMFLKEATMTGRTTREFRYPTEIWPVIESWATQNGYALKKENGVTRLYQKSNWQLMAPACLQVTQQGDLVKLEAWVKADLFLLLSLLTGKQPEARLDSGGLVATLPRRIARGAVNILLSTLGQKPIS